MCMQYLSVFCLLVNLSVALVFAGYNELKAPIEPNTCRLANMYTKDGADYSGSAGATSEGKYPTAESEEECLKMCEESEQSRLEEKPDVYGLRVGCFFGHEKLFEREHE